MRARWLVTLLLLPVVTGCAADAAAPASALPATATTSAFAPTPVTFPTADGIMLTGSRFGAGRTAVVLSNMGDNDPQPWQTFAPLLAARGYLVLTYSYRYPLRTNAFTADMAIATVADLRGAVAFVRTLGASD